MTENENAGHRQRLRERFLARGTAPLPDEMLLELLLSYAITRRDVQPLAAELIRAFGSLAGVLSATQGELLAVKGMGLSSIALLKAMDQIRSGTTDPATGVSPHVNVVGDQPSFFENPLDGSPADSPPPETAGENTEAVKEAPVTEIEPVVEREASVESAKVDVQIEPQAPEEIPKVQPRSQRKLQVFRSHFLDFTHFSRILNLLYAHREQGRISRLLLISETGLPDNHVASLVSVGVAMGLIQPGSQTLTNVGLLVAGHDMFVEQQGTLEWCHYSGAGTYRNQIWFDVFNHLLAEEPAMTQPAWQAYFEQALKDQYAVKTIKRHVMQEVQYIVDVYLEGNFKKLELLQRSPDDLLYRRRYTRFVPAVFCAMVYDFCTSEGGNLSQVGEMATAPGSPAVVFGLDVNAFREQIEGLHALGWLRYETTHNLDQIRLKPGLTALAFLSAYYEGREPQATEL